MHETIRLQGSSPVSQRWALADIELASGVKIAKGDRVTIDLLTANRDVLRGALQRTAILSNEKYRGIRLIIRDDAVLLQAHNPEQEEAEEELEVSYSGDEIEIGFNVNYLVDAIGAVEGDDVTVSVVDSNSSCLIRQPGKDDCKFVVMPMRL